MPQELTERFSRATAYGNKLHLHQKRKGTDIPYVSHLMAVACIVMEHGGIEDEAIAAYLHDAAEDQGGRAVLEEIKQKFGEKVAGIVGQCTDAWTNPKPPWKARKEAYLAHLREEDDPSVLLVSCADKLHNARSILDDYRVIGERLWKRFNADKEEILWYYRSLVAAYRANDAAPKRLARELDRVVSEIEFLSRW